MAENLGELAKMYVKIEADTQTLKSDVAKLKGTLNNDAKDIQKNVGGTLTSTFKGVGAAIFAAFGTAQIVKFGFEAVVLAGKVQGVKRAFESLNQPGLLKDLRNSVKGTVSDFELMQVAMRASNFKIPLTELGTLLEFAKKRATQTGQAVDYLVNSIIDGIGRKSTLVLDNLGISATELQEEFAKTGDFGKATANIIAREMGKMGNVVDTAADELARLNAELENQKAEIGNQLLPVWSGLLKVLGAGVSLLSSMGQEVKRTLTPQKYYNELIKEGTEQQREYASAIQNTYTKMQKLSTFIVSTYKQQKDTVGQVKTKIDELVASQDNLVYGSKEYLKVQKEIEKLEKSIGLGKEGKDIERKITGKFAGDFEAKSLRNLYPNGIDIEARGQMVSIGGMNKVPEIDFDVLAPNFDEQVRIAMVNASTEAVNEMSNIVGLASDFQNKLGIAADTFVGKMISGVEAVYLWYN